MKRKGHVGVGLLLLLPIIYNKRIPYIETSDKYIIQLNNIIYSFNKHFIELNTLLFNINFNFPKLILISLLYYIGIRFPDLDLYLKKISPYFKNHRYLYHRQITHSIFLTLFLMFYYNNNIYLFFFCYGIITHLLADIITGSVPLFFFGKYYKTLNIFQWRIGIDLIYMLVKPKYKKGNTKLQIIINKVKDNIVNLFEKIYPFIIMFFLGSYFFNWITL